MGQTLCDSCYSTYRKHGTFVRSVRTNDGWLRACEGSPQNFDDSTQGQMHVANPTSTPQLVSYKRSHSATLSTRTATSAASNTREWADPGALKRSNFAERTEERLFKARRLRKPSAKMRESTFVRPWNDGGGLHAQSCEEAVDGTTISPVHSAVIEAVTVAPKTANTPVPLRGAACDEREQGRMLCPCYLEISLTYTRTHRARAHALSMLSRDLADTHTHTQSKGAHLLSCAAREVPTYLSTSYHHDGAEVEVCDSLWPPLDSGVGLFPISPAQPGLPMPYNDWSNEGWMAVSGRELAQLFDSDCLNPEIESFA